LDALVATTQSISASLKRAARPCEINFRYMRMAKLAGGARRRAAASGAFSAPHTARHQAAHNSSQNPPCLFGDRAVSAKPSHVNGAPLDSCDGGLAASNVTQGHEPFGDRSGSDGGLRPGTPPRLPLVERPPPKPRPPPLSPCVCKSHHGAPGLCLCAGVHLPPGWSPGRQERLA
jgi:hypothetical protein